MKIRREPLTIDSAFYASDWDVPRALGCHLMGVVEYMETELQIADPTRSRLPPAALEWYRFGGFMLEHAFARHAIDTECRRNPDILQRPAPVLWCSECDMVVYGGAEICTDHCKTYGHHGIHASPDAMVMREPDLDDPENAAAAVADRLTDAPAIHGGNEACASWRECWKLKEWKCTWKSQNRAGGDADTDTNREHLSVGIWRWPMQTKAYAYLMQTLDAELWSMFVNGNYAPPVPSGDRFVMTFDQRELDGAWSSVVSYARKGGML